MFSSCRGCGFESQEIFFCPFWPHFCKAWLASTLSRDAWQDCRGASFFLPLATISARDCLCLTNIGVNHFCAAVGEAGRASKASHFTLRHSAHHQHHIIRSDTTASSLHHYVDLILFYHAMIMREKVKHISKSTVTVAGNIVATTKYEKRRLCQVRLYRYVQKDHFINNPQA
jgi:hypothetical protein